MKERYLFMVLAAAAVLVGCQKESPRGFSGSEPPMQFVDLGLPSGLKWGKWNLGAASEEEYGDYYAWGETAEKSDYSWDTYKWGSLSELSKYCTNSAYGIDDGRTVLEPNDDVAHVKLGGKWRMPTRAEIEELLSNCNSEWTKLNGVKGRKLTSRRNGNSIFFPAAGYRRNGKLNDVGIYCDYWSSSLYQPNPPYAFYLYFDSGGAVMLDCYYRSDGQSVRPVLE